ncbi:MAG: rhomboid family intramembrane serine protease [Flavobacteriales bacterium]|nr:rhomboid family intramembrane serine protease [Flavobacteriales bacterium]
MSYNQISPRGYSMLPEGIKYLLVINVICYLAFSMLKNTPVGPIMESMALYQPGSPFFHAWQIITSVFMHGSFTHLLSNMFALWMFGTVIENIWGTRRFIIYYMITAVGASFLYLAVNQVEVYFAASKLLAQGAPESLLYGLRTAPDLDAANSLLSQMSIYVNHETLSNYYWYYHVPVVGASGAVFGILLAFGMMFPNSMIYIYFLFPIKAKWFVIIYGVIEFISGITGMMSGIAHFAHLGGMLFGYLIIMYWKKKGMWYH